MMLARSTAGCRSLRAALPLAARWQLGARLSSSAAPDARLVIERDADSKVAVVRLNNKPINALNLDFLTELHSTILSLENDKSVRGLVLASTSKKIFSAGLDINEMFQPKDLDRLRRFWSKLQDVFITLYGTRLATAAAIDGEAPAGGCLLALLCDVRFMAIHNSPRIGLNETKLGIVAPTWFADAMVNTVGLGRAEKLLQLGTMLTAQEAVSIGLIDEAVPEGGSVSSLAKDELICQYLAIPDEARVQTKRMLRGPTIERLVKNREADVEFFVNFITSAKVQAGLGRYLEHLKSRSK